MLPSPARSAQCYPWGYLLKEKDTRRLVEAIREVARGGSVFDPQVTRRLAEAKAGGNLAPGTIGIGSLTPLERRLLAVVAQGKTNKEVGVALGRTTKTVST